MQRTTPIDPFKVFRPLSPDEKLQIREAKKLAIERAGSIKGDPVRLVSGDVSLIVDYALIRRFLNTFKPASDWRVQAYLSTYGWLHLRFDYEHKQPLGGHGKAKFGGLPYIHVKVLSRIGLPEIHI